MADNRVNISPFFKFEIKSPARGLTDYDPGAIHPLQQEQLNAYKLKLMRENVIYLSTHEELRAILKWLGKCIMTIRPKNVLSAMGKLFAITERELKRIIMEDVINLEDDLVESEDEEWDY